jgi:hypothetical protein
MRLAWCRSAATRLSDRLDDTAALIAELRSDHDITGFDRSSMHDLVRLDFRQPFDLHVFELADDDDSAVLWPYVLHYPGIVRLRSASLHHSRAASLTRQRRGGDRRAELTFGRGDLTAAPIVASRLVVVHDEYQAASLQRDYPHARIRVAPLGVPMGSDPGDDSTQPLESERHRGLTPRVGVLGHVSRRTIDHALMRAREAGAHIELMADASPDRVLDEADAILVLPWPLSDDLTPAISAMSSGKPIVIFETASTAGWATLDPQTWQPRGLGVTETPIAIAIDPRDEEHSLALALRRLATDASLRSALGRAARAWWERNGTVAHAAAAWRSLIREAASLTAPAHPTGWPPHLTADGTDRAREMLRAFGTSVDFLRT